MTASAVAGEIRTLETQLAVLKAKISQRIEPVPSVSFADLYGILASKIQVSEEDLEAARYEVKWEGDQFP